ncbi:aminoglycoside phosphotransferase family protein [Arthrobacter monumenti]
MANVPAAEIDVSEQLVRRLLTDQHPDLADLPLEQAANGWDNVIFRLGTGLTVRVPRRQQAAQLVLNEQNWLPTMAARVTVDVPAPVRTGSPTAYYPWAWSVCPWFDGVQAAEVPIAERTELAESLADFVAELHHPAPADAPHNPVRGVPLRTRHAAVAQRLASGAIPRRCEVAALWDELSSVRGWRGPALWLHGDLHPANILLDRGRLRAVIDFGDLTAGDPATDLATAWLTFDGEGRHRFIARLNEHGSIDSDTWKRAKGWALTMSTAMLASSDDHPVFRKVGEDSLEQILA